MNLLALVIVLLLLVLLVALQALGIVILWLLVLVQVETGVNLRVVQADGAQLLLVQVMSAVTII